MWRALAKPWRLAAALSAATLAAALVLAGAIAVALDRLGPPPIAAADETSVVVLDRKGRLLRPFATRDGRWRLAIAPERVDPRYIDLLLAYEDKRFHAHRGVDPLAVLRAGWQLVSNGRVVSGASTLTMQVARLLEPRTDRSVATKLREMLRAVQLEARLSKREILALYLKLAPFGGNLEGLRAASLAYFGKEPYRLALHEAALLVALPQSPERRRPDRFARAAKSARDRVIDRALKARVIDEGDALAAKAGPVPERRRPFPMLAAHLAQAEVARAPAQRSHTLTVDRDRQAALEALARARAAQLGPRHSVAILALDHATGEVLAHVGSAGFLDARRFGQIDMTRAVRSPGSALKPFIYGLAFEMGLAHPKTLIEDRPTRFGAYAPRNFDKDYQGTVSVAEALQMSLNVPAVQVLHAVGPTRLLARLRVAGARLALPQAETPGLAVALGGVGIRLVALARLYAAVARGGESVGLRHRFEAPAPVFPGDTRAAEPPRLLTPTAAWYVAKTLRGTPPPENAAWEAIAFKTGTSYGYRDAWAAGFDGRHAIAVWTGRPDGAPAPGLTGINAAAPILHEAFARLGPTRAPFRPAPATAIVGDTADLPPPLRHFRGAQGALQAAGAGGPQIAFPPAGARVEVQRRDAEVAFKADGGALPLTWFVNGSPLRAGAHRRNAFWRPDGRGFVRLTVMDRSGRTDSVVFRVEQAE